MSFTTMTGAAAALWCAEAFALVAALAPLIRLPRLDSERLARACITLAAVFIGAALFAGIQAVAVGDFQVRLVARHLSVNVPASERWLALTADPSIPALVAALTTGVICAVGKGRTERWSAPAVFVALLVFPAVLSGIVGTPSVSLSSGLGLSPFVRSGWRAVEAVAVVAALALAAESVGLAQSGMLATMRVRARWVATLVLSIAFFRYYGDIATGASRAPAPIGIVSADAMVVLAAICYGWSAPRTTSIQSATLASIGVFAVAFGELYSANAMIHVAAIALGAASIGAAVVRGGLARMGTWTLGKIALVVWGSAFLAQFKATTTAQDIATGARVVVAGETLEHQGISLFQGDDYHVESLTLAGGAEVVSLERRDYVNERDESLGAPVSRPVTFHTLAASHRIWLDDTKRGGVAQVSQQTIFMPWLFPLAAILTCATFFLVPRASSSACPRCGVPLGSGAFCSACGAKVGDAA